MEEQEIETTPAHLEFVSDIVAAYVSKNALAAAEIPAMIRAVHGAFVGLSSNHTGSLEPPKPAVPIKKSVTPEYVICLEDGRKLKVLRRYLRARYNLTPEQYRARWNLPHDYPMVAPRYAERRSELAKEIGLGKRLTQKRRSASVKLGQGSYFAVRR